MRPPSPTPAPMRQPLIVPPMADTAQARLVALEVQRAQDHAVMQDIINAILQLRAADESIMAKVIEQDGALHGQTEMGMQLRKEVFAARSDLAAGVSGANDAAQAAAMTKAAVQIESKFSELDKLTQNLGNAV